MSASAERYVEESPHSESQFDSIVSGALERVFEQEEETFSEMLDGFLFLNEGAQNQRDVSNGGSYRRENGFHGQMHHSYVQQTVDNISCDDSISEEEIGPGNSVPPALFRTGGHGCVPIAKVDNFVESDSSDLSSLSDCSDDDASNYIPSSLECTPHSQEKEEEEQVMEAVDLRPIVGLYEEMNSENESGSRYQIVILNEMKETDPLPGQLDDQLVEGEKDFHVHITNLSITTHIKTSGGKDVEETSDLEPENNEVNEFKLDENFDYDNVTLTPKFDIHNTRWVS